MRRLVLFLALCCAVNAQVYSPLVLKKGQVNTTDLKTMIADVYANAGARTPREKAEAIWRFFLTDGRYVKPGFWYHIAGWVYEEPRGEVLDAMKLINSYGFGLCYHIAPLLEAAFDAGGFEDARVWFLTGHTVAEVFYDGSYHYFDSDMMGYTSVGTGPLQSRRVVSVAELETDPQILLNKLDAPDRVKPGETDDPWYPADVRAKAMGDMASLFSTRNDNWLYPYKRYSTGHQMEFTLRPGEKMVRNYQPEKGLFYLPYRWDGTKYEEFPREIAQYEIRTEDGPHSQKDARLWGTGFIEYKPRELSFVATNGGRAATVEMPSPYVIIDANFRATVKLSAEQSLRVETSTDGGMEWREAATVNGPFDGEWKGEPAVLAKSEHGRLTAVSGSYGYLVRFVLKGADAGAVSNVTFTTRIQCNPRSLPELTSGVNDLQFSSGGVSRRELPVVLSRFAKLAERNSGAEYVETAGQGMVRNRDGQAGEVIFAVDADPSHALSSVDVGGRFLDLRGGLAPDKLTAETRTVTPWPSATAGDGSASIEWSTQVDGPYQPVWRYDPKLAWRDGSPIQRLLRWPDIDQTISSIPPQTRRIYVRYRFQGLAVDDFRLAAVQKESGSSSRVRVTHQWAENGVAREAQKMFAASTAPQTYTVETAREAKVENRALVIECLAAQP